MMLPGSSIVNIVKSQKAPLTKTKILIKFSFFFSGFFFDFITTTTIFFTNFLHHFASQIFKYFLSFFFKFQFAFLSGLPTHPFTFSSHSNQIWLPLFFKTDFVDEEMNYRTIKYLYSLNLSLILI